MICRRNVIATTRVLCEELWLKVIVRDLREQHKVIMIVVVHVGIPCIIFA